MCAENQSVLVIAFKRVNAPHVPFPLNLYSHTEVKLISYFGLLLKYFPVSNSSINTINNNSTVFNIANTYGIFISIIVTLP